MNSKRSTLLLILILASCSESKQGVSDMSNQQGVSKAASSKDSLHIHDNHSESFYTCSMHLDIRQSGPGRCPICNMNLTKVDSTNLDSGKLATEVAQTKEGKPCVEQKGGKNSSCQDVGAITGNTSGSYSAGESIARVKLRKSQLNHFRPSFFPVTTMKMTKRIRLLGSVLQSEEKQSIIPARIGGRVEKVYIRSTGSFIKKNDPVLDLYSPKLITAGEEYLLSRNSYQKNRSEEFKQLMHRAQQRLELWGIKRFQYEAWYQQRRVPDHITIYSPSTGIVRQHRTKVGKYFKEGQNFFELSDLTEVWVELDVYERDSAVVKIGQEVMLEFSSSPGRQTRGTIDFINPILNPRSRTLKIRTTVANKDGALKPGMIAEGSLTVVFEGNPLVVPRSAIIDTGKRKVVWIKADDHKYEAKLIRTGFESEGFVEVIEGLSQDDLVVLEGNFLLDAQSQLFGGYSDITR